MTNSNLSNVTQFDPRETIEQMVGLSIESVRPASRNDVQRNDEIKPALWTINYSLSPRATRGESKIERHYHFGHDLSQLIDRILEERRDPEISRFLSGLCDPYCNEAFELAHEVRASTMGTALLARQSIAGLRFDGSLRALLSMLDAPALRILAEPSQAVAGRARCPVLLLRFPGRRGKHGYGLVGRVEIFQRMGDQSSAGLHWNE